MEYRKKILVLNGQYLPGYKGGGPIQSCVNMIENLSDRFDFKVICADRDYKERRPYKGIVIDQWNQVGSANVFYASPGMQRLQNMKELLSKTDYDILYLNGFFSPVFTIRPLLLRRIGLMKKSKVILTPRGDFAGGCENKKLKKYSYIYIVKLIGLYTDLLWHATSEIEAQSIKKKFPRANIFTVPNLPAKYIPRDQVISKNRGELKLVFVSRVFPKKNIKFALEVLQQIRCGTVVFDIYGPMEDRRYWRECQSLIDDMPDHIKVSYLGEVSHNEIPGIFRQYHGFFFPTLGENYGHVIVEAMMSNCLCILSRGVTPWDDYIDALDIGAALEHREKFIEIIENLVKMESEEFYEKVKFTQAYISKKINPDRFKSRYIEMFHSQ